jgi:hypothetical protein
MAAECRDLFARLGLNVEKAIACLDDLPKKLKNALEKRTGAREVYRTKAVKYLVKLWETGAMPYQEKNKVARNFQAIVSAVAPDLDHPKLDFGNIYAAAMEEPLGSWTVKTDMHRDPGHRHAGLTRAAVASKALQDVAGAQRGVSRHPVARVRSLLPCRHCALDEAMAALPCISNGSVYQGKQRPVRDPRRWT